MHNQVQDRFFNLITAKEPLYASYKNPIQTYKEMIHYRFKEVVLSAFPRFTALLERDLLDEIITQFIQSEPQTPYIWQMPDEFRAFLSSTELSKSFPFMEDLLWFEWIEIELFMRPLKKSEETLEFSWETPLKLNESAVVRYLDFPVFKEDSFTEQGDYAVLMHYDFDSLEVHYQEITPFLSQFIHLLEAHSPQVALEIIALEYEVDTQEVKGLLEAPLKGFCNQQIFKLSEELP